MTFFNHACGNQPPRTRGRGGSRRRREVHRQQRRQPRADPRHPSNGRANDGAIVAGDIMTLDLIDAAVEIAKTGGNAGDVKMRPAEVKAWARCGSCTSTDPGHAAPPQHLAGAVVRYPEGRPPGLRDLEEPDLHRGARRLQQRRPARVPAVTQGVAPDGRTIVPTVRRAVLLGAQACTAAFGKGGGENKYRWNEELYDHKRELEVSAWSIWGLKKTTYNGRDFSAIVIPTYAVNAADPALPHPLNRSAGSVRAACGSSAVHHPEGPDMATNTNPTKPPVRNTFHGGVGEIRTRVTFADVGLATGIPFPERHPGQRDHHPYHRRRQSGLQRRHDQPATGRLGAGRLGPRRCGRLRCRRGRREASRHRDRPRSAGGRYGPVCQLRPDRRRADAGIADIVFEYVAPRPDARIHAAALGCGGPGGGARGPVATPSPARGPRRCRSRRSPTS